MKNPKKVKMGKKSKAQGSAFEKKTREDLIEKGWIVDRWSNNVEINLEGCRCLMPVDPSDENSENWQCGQYYDALKKKMYCGKCKGKLIPAKVTWRRTPHGMFPMGLNSGFPDFIAFKKIEHIQIHDGDSTQISIKHHNLYEVIGVESKLTGTLDKLEKQKCRWLIDKDIFSRILVSKKLKIKNKIVVEYIDFVDIEKRMQGGKRMK